MDELARRMLPVARELVTGFRALVVNGPRQAGKSTLVRHLQEQRGRLVSLDDPSWLSLATDDPITFLEALGPEAAIDEFQRGGDRLVLALKATIDARRLPGQFVLAGSTRFLTTGRLSETLTGRIGILELLPLSAGELRGQAESFVDRAFDGDVPTTGLERLSRAAYADAIAAGGFPELALGPGTPRLRTAWCAAYVATVTAGNNLEQIASIRRPELLVDLFAQIAARSGGEYVVADLARELAADESTVRAYMQVLTTLYLVRLLPGWTTSRTNRAKRRPTMHVIDTALGTHLVGATSALLRDITSPWFGPLLESYVVGELAKQASWSEQPVALSHFRDREQREVDVILERGRDIVGIEVKASATPVAAHAKHLAYLRDHAGARFKLGVVLHTGSDVIPLGDRLVAAPISALWAG